MITSLSKNPSRAEMLEAVNALIEHVNVLSVIAVLDETTPQNLVQRATHITQKAQCIACLVQEDLVNVQDKAEEEPLNGNLTKEALDEVVANTEH